MPRSNSKNEIQRILQYSGVTINGKNSWDIQIKDERFYNRLFSEGSLGLGESYMEGWWDCGQIDEMINRILSYEIEEKINPNWTMIWNWLKVRFFNMQSKQRAFIVGKKHYDLNNNLFQKMLDKRMTYSCGYWKTATNLDDAQEAKLELICQKIYLKPGMRVLDIGCGWGSFAKYAAEKYDAQVVGITVSKNQLELGQEMCKGLPVEFRLQDYRDMNESFDRIVSVGQIEHVGYKNYKIYMQIVNKCLKNDGLFLLHTIGSNRTVLTGDVWMQKYIFPNGMLPSINQLAEASEELFIVEDLHNFGPYYDPTLMAWYHNFESHWDEIKGDFDMEFYRMWKYYLLSCAGLFRSRASQLWQIVFSKNGQFGDYQSIR